jgi:hypothetical protein
MKKHWWKWCILLLSAGIAFSGFGVKCGSSEFKKDGVDIIPGGK